MDRMLKGLDKKILMDFFHITISRLVVIGTTLAALISWRENASILWSIVHGVLGWIYVFYITSNWILFSLLLSYLIIGLYKAIGLYLKVKKVVNGTED
jgi:hypothetical protein